MVANGEAAEGYLVIKVLEVAGHDKNDEPVWEPSFKHGYVKGIYIRDLLDAVPVDKYFELFQPSSGLDGGFIRVSVNYLSPEQVGSSDQGAVDTLTPEKASQTPRAKAEKKAGRRPPWLRIGLLVAAAALAATKVAAAHHKR
ncbi:hypothetical protein QBZ16_001381 [Prototheca wickerhamii]|uniref:Uncharacterized protein n=1 Tax=Prototheca wickerhamii TaxID=3111 RepID=A0AAD9IFA0_PROWI|nr:hypothetical protein QBZ16_001381 [Prototheca wickerhamii]